MVETSGIVAVTDGAEQVSYNEANWGNQIGARILESGIKRHSASRIVTTQTNHEQILQESYKNSVKSEKLLNEINNVALPDHFQITQICPNAGLLFRLSAAITP